MRFRAWYADAVYDGESVDDWKALPSEGVVFVVELEDSGGRRLINGGDWYYIDNGKISYVPSKEWGKEEPRPEACLDCVKRGVGVSDEEWLIIRAEAKAYRG